MGFFARMQPFAAMGALLPLASFGIEWDVRDVEHPVMGPIKVAVPKNGVATAAREQKIISAAFVSCEKRTGKVAIELANALESDPKGGLKPAEPPQLQCNTPAQAPNSMLATAVAVQWVTGELGDLLARGIPAASLRRCISIDVLQNVALPAGNPLKSQRVSMELTPYSRELAAVFAECGAKEGWRAARTAATGGKTNVRATPKIDGAVVTQVEAGARILVEPGPGPWWRARPRNGAGFSGYIREDRLAFD
jgi:hypothetical protein